MSDVVDIYNWALAAIGNTARVQAVDEASDEAEACSLFYENVRDQVLRSAPWDCAKGFRRLGVVAERADNEAWVETDPAPGWRFSYGLPSDHLWPRYISTFSKFELGLSSASQRIIYTNTEQPILCYTKRLIRVDLWDADLQAAIGFALAAHICMKLTGSESRVRVVTSQAIDKILTARQAAANAPNAGLEAVPEWLVARGYGGNAPANPFVYPSAEFSYAGFSSALT